VTQGLTSNILVFSESTSISDHFLLSYYRKNYFCIFAVALNFSFAMIKKCSGAVERPPENIWSLPE